MRHGNNVRKFGREKNQRKALMKSLVISLIRHDRITTTEAKAKELRPMIEKIVTRAKENTTAAKRIVLGSIYNRAPETKRMFDTIAPKYKDTNGGYTRIMKLPPRKGDAANMAIIEFV